MLLLLASLNIFLLLTLQRNFQKKQQQQKTANINENKINFWFPICWYKQNFARNNVFLINKVKIMRINSNENYQSVSVFIYNFFYNNWIITSTVDIPNISTIYRFDRVVCISDRQNKRKQIIHFKATTTKSKKYKINLNESINWSYVIVDFCCCLRVWSHWHSALEKNIQRSWIT